MSTPLIIVYSLVTTISSFSSIEIPVAFFDSIFADTEKPEHSRIAVTKKDITFLKFNM